MTFWTHSYPVARKPHYCDMCQRQITRGEKYLRGAGLDSGTVQTWAECLHCEAFRLICDLCDPYSSEYGPDEFYEFEPSCEVTKSWKSLWRAKWLDDMGELASIPHSSMLPVVAS